MVHRFIFKVVDRSFRNITQINKSFGGIIFIMSEDYRQILPVMIRRTYG